MTGEVVCGYRLLRELGARALPAYAAIDPKPRNPGEALCVVEQLVREPGVGAEGAAGFLRDAKRLSQLHHPNVVRVRDVVVGANTVLLVSDWVEGETLSEVERAAASRNVAIPLGVTLRLLLDILEGLSALHDLRDAKRDPLNLVHAEVAPRNIVVGLDGRAVLTHPLHAPSGDSKRHPPDVAGYLAPEVLLGDQTLDQRADVFGAGVLLWEALMGQRMHPEGEDVGEIVMRLLGGRIEAPSAPADAPWAAALADAAKKATAADPTARFANATSMLTDVRRAIGTRLAAKSVVAALVESTVGDQVRARGRALLPVDLESTPLAPPPASTRGQLPSVSIPIDHEPYEDAATVVVQLPASFAPSSRGSSSRVPTPGPAQVAPSSSRVPASRAPTPVPASRAATPVPSSRVATPVPASRGPTPVPVPSSSHIAPSRASPPSSGASAPPSSNPTSADVVEVIEMEVPQDRPSRPKVPPPFRPRDSAPAQRTPHAPAGPRAASPPSPLPEVGPPPGSVRVPMPSKTDVGSLALVSTTGSLAPPASNARTKWMIALACTIGLAVVTWLIVRGGDHTESADVPPPASTVLEPPLAPPASATPAAAPPVETSTAASAARGGGPVASGAPAGSAPGPFNPPGGDDHETAAPRPPPQPGAKEVPPFPVAPSSAPAAPANQPPAASSPRGKKRVYDPMGI